MNIWTLREIKLPSGTLYQALGKGYSTMVTPPPQSQKSELDNGCFSTVIAEGRLTFSVISVDPVHDVENPVETLHDKIVSHDGFYPPYFVDHHQLGHNGHSLGRKKRGLQNMSE